MKSNRSFWPAFLGGWLVMACILSVLVTAAGAHEFSGIVAAGIWSAVHVFSAITGYLYARGG